MPPWNQTTTEDLAAFERPAFTDFTFCGFFEFIDFGHQIPVGLWAPDAPTGTKKESGAFGVAKACSPTSINANNTGTTKLKRIIPRR